MNTVLLYNETQILVPRQLYFIISNYNTHNKYNYYIITLEHNTINKNKYYTPF